MTDDLLKLANTLQHQLTQNCPKISGNMKAGINIASVNDNEITIVIDAPFYDVKLFEIGGGVVYTGSPKKYPDVTSYAYWVNERGGFGTRNSSMYWVNRACYETANAIAGELNADVINKLPL